MNLKSRNGVRHIRLTTLLILLGGGLLPLHAHAFISGSMSCSVSGYPTNGYTFQAGAEIKIPFSGTCQAVRAYPYGAGNNLQITPVSGANPARIQVLDPYSYTYMSQLPLGSYGPSCLGGRCSGIAAGTSVSYTYYVVGTAPSTPGRRMVKIDLGVTSANYPAYAEWIHSLMFIYNVSATSCSLSSPSNVNLNFGTLSSANVSDNTQHTSISINCPSAMRASLNLTPSQAAVNGTSGLSRTTLPGLNMQAKWGQDPVNFNSYIYRYLNTGTNTLDLNFVPVLEPGQSPSGAFQSQYTLTINYL